jgi:hypothetical protein
LRCVAGGTFNANGNPNQHLDGVLTPFTLFLNKKTDSVKLDGRQYTWAKCNPDFRSYYVSRYQADVYESFTEALGINHKVRVD